MWVIPGGQSLGKAPLRSEGYILTILLAAEAYCTLYLCRMGVASSCQPSPMFVITATHRLPEFIPAHCDHKPHLLELPRVMGGVPGRQIPSLEVVVFSQVA